MLEWLKKMKGGNPGALPQVITAMKESLMGLIRKTRKPEDDS